MNWAIILLILFGAVILLFGMAYLAYAYLKKRELRIKRIDGKDQAELRAVRDDSGYKKYEFHLHNAQIVHNLEELAVALQLLNDKDFSFHISPKRNDFALWIEKMIDDSAFAKAVSKIKDKDELIAAIETKIEQDKEQEEQQEGQQDKGLNKQGKQNKRGSGNKAHSYSHSKRTAKKSIAGGNAKGTAANPDLSAGSATDGGATGDAKPAASAANAKTNITDTNPPIPNPSSNAPAVNAVNAHMAGIEPKLKNILTGGSPQQDKDKTDENSTGDKKSKESVGLPSMKAVHTLLELVAALKNINENEFQQMMSDKETFLKWLSEINDADLIRRLAKMSNRGEMEELIKEEMIKPLIEEYNMLKKRISFLRKRGKDVFMLDIELMNIPPVIQMAKVTLDNKDIKKIQGMLNAVRQNIEKKESEQNG